MADQKKVTPAVSSKETGDNPSEAGKIAAGQNETIEKAADIQGERLKKGIQQAATEPTIPKPTPEEISQKPINPEKIPSTTQTVKMPETSGQTSVSTETPKKTLEEVKSTLSPWQRFVNAITFRKETETTEKPEEKKEAHPGSVQAVEKENPKEMEEVVETDPDKLKGDNKEGNDTIEKKE